MGDALIALGGAFLAGMIIAETTVAARVEKLVLPLRDAFAALFFFAFASCR